MFDGRCCILTRRGSHENQSQQKQFSNPPLGSCIAKIIEDESGRNKPGLDVESHCKIVGLVAKELVERFPILIRESLFPTGVELIAAVHDIGKVNPHFQEKMYRLLPDYVPNSNMYLSTARPELEKNIGMHGGVSQVALDGVGEFIAEIAGMHHGSSPGSQTLLPEDSLLGGPIWQQTRMELITHLKKFFLTDFPAIRNTAHASVVAGLTTVADWIGSGPVFENLTTADEPAMNHMVREAVDRAGFIHPMIKKDLLFEEIFPSYSPRLIQKTLYDNVDGPGVYILEALMGSGKTEAALYAAYRLLASGQANGIYFALPTRITSEKIHERLEDFLHRILLPEDSHKALLAHGTAWMADSEMGEDARPGCSWFESRKRRLLAPFAVGTIDQALMAVMNVTHGFVRTFGLAGKVVILDEVHTYDAYTGTIIDHLVHALRELGSTVIVLSATLTEARKLSVLSQHSDNELNTTCTPYPLVSKVSTEENLSTYTLPIEHIQQNVQISLTDDDEELLEIVRASALAGTYVLWIENTVNEAQKVFRSLAGWGQDNGVQVGLIHSRFPTVKRNELENYWVGRYGKEGIDGRKGIGRILVGTQVLEQSLDIDADLLVTRFAPTDMVLQRIGRLWRHRAIDAFRPKGSRQQVYILAPPIQKALKDPNWAFGPSGKVYAPYILARSLQVFGNLGTIMIPADMRNLIEETYREQYEDTRSMSEAKHELEKNRTILQTHANISMTKIGKAASDNISTRYSELPTCDVLLLKEGSNVRNGTLILIDGTHIAISSDRNVSKEIKKRLARECMLRLISVPIHLAPKPVPKFELSRLEPILYISESDEERMRVAIVHPSGKIDGLSGREPNDRYILEYSDLLGYATRKIEEGV